MERARAMVERGFSEWFGAFENGELVSSMGLCVRAGVGRVQSVVTSPRRQRQGLCSTLLARVMEQGFDEMTTGDETNTDCGGSCTECQLGQTCNTNDDCGSGYCTGEVCTVPTCEDDAVNGQEEDVDCGGPDCEPCEVSGGLAAVVSVNSDWGAGYCANVILNNTALLATTSWSLALNTHGTTITGGWGAQFVGASGTVMISSPTWDGSIGPGDVDSSVGFCANRGTDPSAVAAVTSSAAEY
jgi:cellulase/cellobiase CelA1